MVEREKQRDFFDILSLCFRSKCPICSKGRLFAPFFEINSLSEIFFPLKKCVLCQFIFKREPGYYSGALMPTLSILSAFTGLSFSAIYYLVYRPEEFNETILAGIIGALFGMILFMRASIMIFISIDHAISPPKHKI